MFKYTLQNEADQQVNVQAAARDQYTSPPATPLTPIQANSLLYIINCINNVVSTTDNTLKTVSKYQLFSNATRKRCEPKHNFYKHA